MERRDELLLKKAEQIVGCSLLGLVGNRQFVRRFKRLRNSNKTSASSAVSEIWTSGASLCLLICFSNYVLENAKVRSWSIVDVKFRLLPTDPKWTINRPDAVPSIVKKRFRNSGECPVFSLCCF